MKVSEMPSDPGEREMAEPVTDEVRSSVATVVKGFTVAELALRDVALAIERFRSAAEQLSQAREDQASARVALLETAHMADRVAVQISAVVEGLRDTTAVLRGIDPDRLWSHLDKLDSEQAATAKMIRDWIPTVDRRLVKLHEQQSATAEVMAARMTVVCAELGKIEGQQSVAAATLEAWMTRFWAEVEKVEREQSSATRRLAWLSGGSLAAGLVGVAILVAIVAHVVAI
jgi:hypothetical protein